MSPGSDINLESPENLFISRQAQIGQLYFELGGFIDFLQRQMIVSDSDTDILNTVLLDSTNSQPDLDLSTCTEEDFLSLLAACYANLGSALMEVLGPSGDQNVLSFFVKMIKRAMQSYENCPSAFQILATTIDRLERTSPDARISDLATIEMGQAPAYLSPSSPEEDGPLQRISDLVDMDKLIGREKPKPNIDIV